MRYRYDAVGVHLTGIVDRDVFTQYETFIREVKPDRIGLAGFVVQNPATALTMNEMTVLILLVWSQPRDSAGLAMRAPERRIDPVVHVEWSDNDIGDARIALGVAWFAGKLDTYLSELRRQGGIQDRLEM